MRFFLAFFSAMSVSIGFLNIFGGIVSGIWLAFLGQWRPIDIGLLSLFRTTWLIGFALMPGLLFAAPAAMPFERGHRFTDVALAKLYTTAVIVTWSYLVLLFFARMATPTSLLPILLWSYGIATGPWAFLAQDQQGDGGNPYSLLNVFFLSVAYIIARSQFGSGELPCRRVSSYLALRWLSHASLSWPSSWQSSLSLTLLALKKPLVNTRKCLTGRCSLRLEEMLLVPPSSSPGSSASAIWHRRMYASETRPCGKPQGRNS